MNNLWNTHHISGRRFLCKGERIPILCSIQKVPFREGTACYYISHWKIDFSEPISSLVIPLTIIFAPSIVKFLKRDFYTPLSFPVSSLTHEVKLLFSPFDHNVLVSSDLHISQSSSLPLSLIRCGWLLHRPWNCCSHVWGYHNLMISFLSYCYFIVLFGILSFPSFWNVDVFKAQSCDLLISTLSLSDPIWPEKHNFTLKITP